MPDIVFAGNATYPGVKQTLDCSYTCGWSTTPGRIVLSISPQDVSEIQGTGDLVLTDGVNQPLPFKDCQVVDLQAPSGDSGPLILTLYDGRWRWDFGAVSARYNIPWDRSATISPLSQPVNPAGNPILPPPPAPKGEEVIRRKATAPELAKILLEGMKVKKYDLAGLDPNATPHVEWDSTNPAQALAQLASDLGCVVAFNPSTLVVSILTQGSGDGLPPGELRVAPQLRARPRPDVLQCRGAFDRVQMRVVLMAVGLDFDGSFRPFSKLSYRPIDGDWTKIQPATFAGLAPDDYLPGRYLQKDALALAQASVYRYYVPLFFADPAQDVKDANDLDKPGHPNPVIEKIEKELNDPSHPKPPKVYGVRFRTKKSDKPKTSFYDLRLLPFKNEVTIDDTGRNSTVPAKCYGKHTPPDACKLGGSVLTKYDDTDEQTEVRVSFSIVDIGNDDQAALFSKPVYSYKVDQKVYPAEIVVECAVELALESGQWYRTGWDLKLPSGPGAAKGAVVRAGGILRPTGTQPTQPGVIVRNDVIFKRTAKYDKGHKLKNLTDNEEVVRPRAEYYLRGESRKYELVVSGDATYPGIRPFFPTGTWMQVTWSISGPTTQLSMNTEHALYLPPFEERRRQEQTTLEGRRREIDEIRLTRVIAGGIF